MRGLKVAACLLGLAAAVLGLYRSIHPDRPVVDAADQATSATPGRADRIALAPVRRTESTAVISDNASESSAVDDPAISRRPPVGRVPAEASPAQSPNAARSLAAPTPVSNDGPLGNLNTQFLEEKRDPAWSSAIESRIFAEVARLPGFAANAIDVECRATQCRVRLTLPVGDSAWRNSLITVSDDRPVFVVAEAMDLETMAVLAIADDYGTPIFLAYIARPKGNGTRSV